MHDSRNDISSPSLGELRDRILFPPGSSHPHPIQLSQLTIFPYSVCKDHARKQFSRNEEFLSVRGSSCAPGGVSTEVEGVEFDRVLDVGVGNLEQDSQVGMEGDLLGDGETRGADSRREGAIEDRSVD